jgi:hypothetical protein
MHEVADRVRRLMAEAAGLPLSTFKLALLQEAVQLADTHNDIDLGIEARRPLMIVARSLLRGDILTVAFTWCLAHYDREPKRFQGRDLFWEHQMVIGQLANLADVTRATLEALLDDLGRRLQAAGRSLYSRFVAQRTLAPDLGDRPLARAASRVIRERFAEDAARDPLHERYEELMTELFLGNEERTLELAPFLLSARSFYRPMADEVRHRLLLPLLKRGRVAEAAQLEREARRSYYPEQCYYWSYGERLKWMALTCAAGQAVRCYEECQRAIHSWTDPLTRLHFTLDALVLFDRLKRTGPDTLSMRLSDLVPVAHDHGRYSVDHLRDWLLREATALAEQFDRRNGTSYFREQLVERAELQRWAAEV